MQIKYIKIKEKAMIENIYKEKISVIIPIYNVENYLERCLNTVCGQVYKNLEIILIDDGSTDNSLQVCKKFEKRDDRIKVIHLRKRIFSELTIKDKIRFLHSNSSHKCIY